MIRVSLEGCFDLFHYGHANSIRQAKEFGDILVVGLHDDETILKNKGMTVMKEEERYRMLYAMKWVDEVVEGCLYYPTIETLQTQHCQFAVHGDDPSIALNGEDTYKALKDVGMFKTFKRTKGISTTEIIEKILSCGNECVRKPPEQFGLPISEDTGIFLCNGHWLTLFSEGNRKPTADDVVVYVDGCWDLLNAGHIDFLEAASKLGTYLIVGIHSHELVKAKHGSGRPIMNLMERTLTLLACKLVSDVVIGAPYQVTQEVITELKIDIVCSGSTTHKFTVDPYLEAKNCGKFKLLVTDNKLKTDDIIERVLNQKDCYQIRNEGKYNLP